jgi:DNA recombination protein RmuC
MDIEERAQEIIQNLGRLDTDFQRFRDDFETLGRHLSNARGKFEDADRKLGRFGDKLAAIEQSKALPESSAVDPG